MNSSQYAITFACYNQLEYTRQCIDSMIAHGDDLSRLIVIDNGSADDTVNYLQQLPLGEVIPNKGNLGCGVAWNQGVLARQAEWSIIMNNDVLVSKNWLENLITTAEKNQLKVISPSLIEGPLDYDFDSFAENASEQMHNALRRGACHAVCMAVHDSVWAEVGYFQPVPKLLGYEDTLFFHELDKAGIEVAITGSSWLHHFGSITQSAMKKERGLAENDNLAYRYNYRLLKQRWLKRKLKKLNKKRMLKDYRQQELEQYGISMHGVRENNDFVWR